MINGFTYQLILVSTPISKVAFYPTEPARHPYIRNLDPNLSGMYYIFNIQS